jgi:hypothetical protein
MNRKKEAEDKRRDDVEKMQKVKIDEKNKLNESKINIGA